MIAEIIINNIYIYKEYDFKIAASGHNKLYRIMWKKERGV